MSNFAKDSNKNKIEAKVSSVDGNNELKDAQEDDHDDDKQDVIKEAAAAKEYKELAQEVQKVDAMIKALSQQPDSKTGRRNAILLPAASIRRNGFIIKEAEAVATVTKLAEGVAEMRKKGEQVAKVQMLCAVGAFGIFVIYIGLYPVMLTLNMFSVPSTYEMYGWISEEIAEATSKKFLQPKFEQMSKIKQDELVALEVLKLGGGVPVGGPEARYLLAIREFRLKGAREIKE